MLTIKIRREGLPFKLAYGWATNPKAIKQLNLCKLFWRAALGLFMVWPFFMLVAIILSLILFLFGWRLAWFKGDKERPSYYLLDGEDDGIATVHFKRWPKINGRRFWPFWLVLTTAVAIFVYSVGPTVLKFASPFVLYIGLAFVALVALVFLILLSKRFWESETGQLFRAWLKARKDKVCPIIEVSG